MKHTFIVEIDHSGTLDQKDIQDWLEDTLIEKNKIGFGETYRINVKPEKQPPTNIKRYQGHDQETIESIPQPEYINENDIILNRYCTICGHEICEC